MALIVSNEDRLLRTYLDAVKEHWDSLVAIKEWLQESPPQVSAAIEAWEEVNHMDRDSYLLLWRAPTKGSIFTTRERALLKGIQ